IIQPLKKAITDAIRLSMLEHRTFPVPHRKSFAARRYRDRVSLGMQCVGIEEAGGMNELAVALCTQAGKLHLKMAVFAGCRMIEVKIGAAVIDQALPIA